MNDLWDRLGYMSWKYSKDFWCLCNVAGGEYIWVYANRKGLMEDMKAIKRYGFGANYNIAGMNVLEVHGPCGPIRIL